MESDKSYGHDAERRKELPDAIPYDYMLPRANFSQKYKFLYVDTPKVACSSVKSTIQRAECEGLQVRATPRGRVGFRALVRRLLNRETASIYSDHLVGIHDRTRSPLRHPATSAELSEMLRNSRFTFCFVRNPYTRVLSAFLDKIERKTPQRDAYLSGLDLHPSQCNGDVTFNRFVEQLSRQVGSSMNEHWRPQYIHIRPDLVQYSAVGVFERISHDLPKILHHIDPVLPSYIEVVDEHATRSRDKMKQYYDSASVRFVQETYKHDFLLYGYSFDPTVAHEPPVSP